MKNNQTKYPDILTRFRKDVQDFSQKFGGIDSSKNKNSKFKRQVSRKEKRKLERKLKHAKNLAFRRAEKMPSLETLINEKKFAKKKKNSDDKKPIELTRNVEQKNQKQQKQMNTIEMIENRIKNEDTKKKKFEMSFQKMSKKKLIEDNLQEEKEIAKLEKLLHIKKGTKKYQKAFYDEGYDDLLDFCDEDKRKEMLKKEGNIWFGVGDEETPENEFKKDKLKRLNEQLEKDQSDNSSQSDLSQEEEEEEDSFFKAAPNKTDVKLNKKKVKFEDQKEQQEEEEEEEEWSDATEIDTEDNDEEMEQSFDDDQSQNADDIMPKNNHKKEKEKEKLKEDIYGRLIDRQGNVIKSEKYIPPGQRLKQLLDSKSTEKTEQLAKLSKKLNGLLNRLSTSNMHSIANEIIQMFYSNQFTRYDLIETLLSLLNKTLIVSSNLTPIRLIVEHSALICILSNQIGIEVGANILQNVCFKINDSLNSDSQCLKIENKTLDNLILFLCNIYNFKLFSSNLIINLVDNFLCEKLQVDSEQFRIEKYIDLILLIFRCIGFQLRKDNPIMLKETIIKLQSKINMFKGSSSNEEINNRLKFMIESINAIKNNDMRRLDTFDQSPIELIKKQMKNLLKEEKSDQSMLNISFNDIINANELGRWWIVGSAWSLKENQNQNDDRTKPLENSDEIDGDSLSNGEQFSEKILQLAKEQHMNTDIRRAIFCIIVSAEDFTDAFIKLMKLSLKKQQEREIVYIIVHCAINEKKYNPYYSYLMQKFCDYDRRFKMTLQFYTWDKFKMLNAMSDQQIINFSLFYSHLICVGSVTLVVLKNIEFGEMNKYISLFLRQLFTSIFMETNDQKISEIFTKITADKKLSHLRNALKLFIVHFMLTDKGKDIEIDEKLKEKCQLAEKLLSLNGND